jgi:hypothetical protein
MTKYAEGPALDAAKKRLAEERELSDVSRAEYGAHAKPHTPTPTQEEADMTMLGAHILEHDDDGSGPDPFQTRHLEGGKPGNYQTRQVTAQHRATPPRRAE